MDQTQLRELIGDAELRDLLDLASLEAVEQQLQRLESKYHVKHADGVHDLLLTLGDLTADEIAARTVSPEVAGTTDALVRTRRVVPLSIGDEIRFVPVELAARYRDALGTPLPEGLPESLLSAATDPLGDLAVRYARTRAPFPASALAERYGLTVSLAETTLTRLALEGRLLEGEYRPGGTRQEWTDAGVLRHIRRRSLARLRHEVEPVDQAVLGRFSTAWQGLLRPRHGADALLDVVEQLQGAPLAASILETEILPARLSSYDAADLDTVIAAGEVVWVGLERLGDRDGRVALFLADSLPRLFPSDGCHLRDADLAALSTRAAAILTALANKGASFFGPLLDAVGGGYPGDTVDGLWDLVWRGMVTNDTLQALRAFTRARSASRRRQLAASGPSFRSRRLAPPAAEGRWSLVGAPTTNDAPSAGTAVRSRRGRRTPAVTAGHTAWATAVTQQLLARHGVLTREGLAAEAINGGFAVVYPALKAMEEAGRVRRGYFVAGLGATQFALPGAVDLLRSLRDAPESPELVELPATDPANPHGTTLKWPAASATGSAGRGPTRTVGATVVLADGALVAYLARGDRQLVTWLPDNDPPRTRVAVALARVLLERARRGGDTPRGMLIEEIDGLPAQTHLLARVFVNAGFAVGAMGLQATRERG